MNFFYGYFHSPKSNQIIQWILFRRHTLENMSHGAPSKQSNPIAKATNLPFTINEYSFTKLIGKGGFAEVFLVTHTKYGQEFVAKVMTVDQTDMEYRWEVFDAEVKALIHLNHPNIIRLYDHFQINSQFYLILEYCPYGSLHDEILKTDGLSFPRFLDLGKQLADSLSYCHDKQIAHRDIKPGNILMDEYHMTKIADFGLSIATHAGQLNRQFGGSYMFSSPEIFQKKPHDPFIGDVWALGVVFSMMLTGSKPWKCDTFGALKEMAIKGAISFAKKIPGDAEDLIRKMLIIEPTQRITMKQVRNHILFTGKRSFLRISVPKKISVRWDTIKRGSNNDDFALTFPEEFDLSNDEENLITTSPVMSATSVFTHHVNSNSGNQIRPRVHHTSIDLNQINLIDDEISEI
ncbi:CAMK family protein kinase [Tritrichomonas foetus]|uniref:CAMK family protein kinase n=1 Tax=Tritrichomonas foetus TaxID=1144522 RepID=A0A1J4K037_9EUKA|nr:CAMK family protein kinase [Tritrichomonas foetus]|eukprot:OHT04306.1 CAMK family protein kinase [Tritrichomonas foetus]